MDKKEVYWHLPGFYYFFYLNQIIINLMKEYPDKFRDGYKIGSVYGTFPGAIWNGGRTVLGISSKNEIEQVISTYNKLSVPVRFTWTNSCLEEKHVYDTYCNLIMDIANNGMNQVLVNTPVLEEYLRNKYSDNQFKFISSTTKRIVSLDVLKEEVKKDYFMCVLDYDMNHNKEALEELKTVADRIEILVDEICFPHCPKRTEHYRIESMCQLNFDKGTRFQCPNISKKPEFSDCMQRPGFISNEEISDYISDGYVNFKLVGRGLPIEMVRDSYLYFLVKDEARDFIADKLNKALIKSGSLK